MTGSSLPAGYDTVVPLEEALEEDGIVRIQDPVIAGSHVRVRGEDVKEGDRVLRPGVVLRPPEISLIVSFGRIQIPFFRNRVSRSSRQGMSWWNRAR